MKRTNTKRALVLSMALAVMFSFAACSGKDEKADSVKDSQTETAGEAGTEEVAVAEENAVKEGKTSGQKWKTRISSS